MSYHRTQFRSLTSYARKYLFVEAINQLIPVDVIIFSGYGLFRVGQTIYAYEVCKYDDIIGAAEPVRSANIPEEIQAFVVEWYNFVDGCSTVYKDIRTLSKEDIGTHAAIFKGFLPSDHY